MFIKIFFFQTIKKKIQKKLKNFIFRSDFDDSQIEKRIFLKLKLEKKHPK